MTRGLLINGVHTYSEWGLILTQNDIGLPQPKYMYVDIPSGDGAIDLTESLTSEVSYSNRQGSFEFDLLNHWRERAPLIEQIGSHIHGRKVTIYLPDDPEWYYVGRLTIKSFDKNKTIGKLKVESNCEPWKYKKIQTIYNITIDSTGEKSITCKNSRKRVIPTIKTDGEITITFNNNSYTLGAGTHRITNIVLTEGNNDITFSGTEETTLSVEYREGAI